MSNARPAETHLDRRRAESFGGEAERYERARPDYPDEVSRELDAGPGTHVLDVGCGTGKAARLFARAGCEVLGVEIDPRMAEVARRTGVTVEVGAFESWDDDGRRFDLVVSGQAWHWVDPDRGPPKAARLLRPGGALAPFWNYRRAPEPEIRAAFEECYRRFAPELATRSLAMGGPAVRNDTARMLEGIRGTGAFEEPRVLRYPWSARYSAAAWRDLLNTHSDHHLLGQERLGPLLDAVDEVVDGLGGELRVEYETLLVIAELRR
ncbi:MAG: SAM-dependent methyltransferase [Acidimicrobiaceae bacterium]|nr:SAM-dependent methyltransferase [Acidimicrobiaceae bacterium]